MLLLPCFAPACTTTTAQPSQEGRPHSSTNSVASSCNASSCFCIAIAPSTFRQSLTDFIIKDTTTGGSVPADDHVSRPNDSRSDRETRQTGRQHRGLAHPALHLIITSPQRLVKPHPHASSTTADVHGFKRLSNEHL